MLLAQFVSFAIGWPILLVMFLAYMAAISTYVFLIWKWRGIAWIGLVLGLLSLGISLASIIDNMERLRTMPPTAGNYQAYKKHATRIMVQEVLDASPFYVPAILCSLIRLLWKRAE